MDYLFDHLSQRDQQPSDDEFWSVRMDRDSAGIGEVIHRPRMSPTMADVLRILSIQVGNFVGKLRSLEYEKTGNQASRPSPVSARLQQIIPLK